MEINQAELKKLENTIPQVEAEEKSQEPKPILEGSEKVDLAPIKPMIHRLHTITVDMLGYEPDDELIKGLDDEALALIEYYAPVLQEKYVRLFGYLGTWGLVLALSKKKGEKPKEEKKPIQKTLLEVKKDVQHEDNKKPNPKRS